MTPALPHHVTYIRSPAVLPTLTCSTSHLCLLNLYHTNLKGRAEPCRLALVIGGLPFEDDRFKFDQFDEIKKRTPYKAVPVMTLDGKEYAQTHAILRYIGRQVDLYPVDDPIQALRVDEVIDTVSDLFGSVYHYRGDDKELLRTQREKLLKEDVPKFFGGLEKRVEVFGDGPFAVGDNVTIADLTIVSLVNTFKCGVLDFVPTDALDGYTRMMRSYHTVMEMPQVRKWYKKHPIKGVTDQ